jgi:hypothetical protein
VKPAKETTMIEIPITINDHCKNFKQSVLLALPLSHIPSPRMGIDSKKVKEVEYPYQVIASSHD